MNPYTVIIVENDEDEQFFITEGIQETGLFHIMAQVYNGEGLFEWLESHPGTMPGLVLSDLNMPGKNGYDIISEMKNKPAYAHIPVIIMSTSSTKMAIDKCMALGAVAYIEKPETFVEYSQFLKKLHQLIAEKQFIK